MSFAENSIKNSDYDQLEYNYHLDQANYYLKCAEKSALELNSDIENFFYHMLQAEISAHKNFLSEV